MNVFKCALHFNSGVRYGTSACKGTWAAATSLSRELTPLTQPMNTCKQARPHQGLCPLLFSNSAADYVTTLLIYLFIHNRLSILSTVRPLLSGHLLSGHPPLSGHFPKSRFIWYLYSTATLLSGCGHLFAVASVLFIWFLPPLSSQQVIFPSEMVTDDIRW